MLRRGFIGGLLAALAGCSAGRSAPRDPLALLLAHDPSSTIRLDHGAWDGLLKRHRRERSDRVSLFPYGEVRLTEQELLGAYIEGLAALPVWTLNRHEQYAYWLNLHNAILVREIMAGYMISSVQQLSGRSARLGPGPWDRKSVRVGGVTLGLEDIRDRILRPVWRDPRLHYGLLLGAIGGPNMPGHAFTGAAIDRQLDDAALEFVNHPRAVRRQDGKLVLSSLYRWYFDDFGGSVPALLAHLRLYAGPELDRDLGIVRPVEFAFDWSLNDATGLPK